LSARVTGYVSLCPELDIASQGDAIEEARKNLLEALELFFETASATEDQTRLHEEVYATCVEVAIGYTSRSFWKAGIQYPSAAPPDLIPLGFSG